jgi:hypothetical protein
MRPITLLEIKQALRDARFRESIPASLTEDLQKYLKNPSCACNTPFYKKILKDCKDQILAYFPGREVGEIESEIRKIAENNWSVINCSVGELESKLRKLGPGRKQIAMSRYEDQVTLVVNELDVIY